MLRNKLMGGVGGPSDPNFANVSLLLHGDGTNGSQSFPDNSNNSFAVTANGNAQVSTAVKKYGTGSMYFDGSGDWLVAQSSSVSSLGTGDFTFEAWLYPTSFTTAVLFRRWFSFGTGPWNDFTVNLNTSGYLVFRINDSAQLTSTTALTLNTWQHVALTRSSGTVRFFVNGIVAGSATVTTNVNTQGLSPLYVGVEAGYSTAGSSGEYIGYIDDMRITKGVARYTANFTPPTQAFPNQ